MPRPGFYNDNEYRAYPFVYKIDYFGATLPDSAVVDCGIIMGLSSGFSQNEHEIWLAAITRSSGLVRFEFATDAPGAAAVPLVFECAENGDEWTSVFNESGAAADIDPACVFEPAWEGFLVPGPLTELIALLDENGGALSFPARERTLEPGRVQSLVKSYVRSVNLGNLPRVRALPPSDCQTSSDSLASADIVVNAVCMQGDLRIKEGYNCRIKQTDRLNDIRIGAEQGAGDAARSELCDHGSELPLYDGEPFDEETGFYSGGPACDQTISTINGIGGTNVNIVGGTGVTVTANSATNTVTVALAQNNLVGNCGT
jgi:hypothetical protein